MTYKIPVYKAEEVAQNNHSSVTEQMLGQLIQIIGTNIIPLQPELSKLMEGNAQARAQINNQLSLDRLNGGGQLFVNAWQNANETERERLVGELPKPAAAPFDREQLLATIKRLLTETVDGNVTFLHDIDRGDELLELQKRLGTDEFKLALEHSAVYKTAEGQQNPELQHLVVAYKLPGAPTLNRLLVATLTPNGQMAVELKIFVPTERTWLDDPMFQYFSDKDINQAFYDHPTLNAAVHQRQLDRSTALADLRQVVANDQVVTALFNNVEYSAVLSDSELTLTNVEAKAPADLTLNDEIVLLKKLYTVATENLTVPALAVDTVVSDDIVAGAE